MLKVAAGQQLLPESSDILQPMMQGYQMGKDLYSRSVMEDAGQYAARGDMQGAERAAFKGGNFDLAQKLQTMSFEKQAMFHDTMTKYSRLADTPEKWAQLTSTMAKRFGPESVKGFEDFSARGQALQISMSAAEMAKNKLAEQKMAQEERLKRAELAIDRDKLGLMREQMNKPQFFHSDKEGMGYFDPRTRSLEMLKQPTQTVELGTPQAKQKFLAAMSAGYSPLAARMFATDMLKFETDPVTKKRSAIDAFGQNYTEEQLRDPTFRPGSPLKQAPQRVAPPGVLIDDSQPQDGMLTPTSGPESGTPSIALKPGPATVTKPPRTLYENADRVTGIGPVVKERVSNVTEAVPGIRWDLLGKADKVRVADFNLFKNEVKRVLSLSSRGTAVYEQKIIDELFDRGVLTSPDKMRAQLESLHDMLVSRIQTEESIANDDRQSVEARRSAINFVNTAKRAVASMGVPPMLGPDEAREAVKQGLLKPGMAFRDVDGNVRYVRKKAAE